MDLWLISGDEPPANEMVFSSKSFHLRKQKSTVNTSCRRTVQRNISESWRRTGTLGEPSSRKRRVVGKILRVFLWWSPGHQLVDLPLCGADDVEGFVVWKEITSLNVIKTTLTHKKEDFKMCFLRRDHRLTCSYWADQQRVQLHQRAEGGLAVSAASSASTKPAGWVPQLQPVVWAPLQKDQAVWQQQRLNLWWGGGRYRDVWWQGYETKTIQKHFIYLK